MSARRRDQSVCADAGATKAQAAAALGRAELARLMKLFDVPPRPAIAADKLVDVFEAPLTRGHFGSVNLATYPFRILLNERVVGPRRDVSLIHEMLHVYMRLAKMDDFDHGRLHLLALFIYGSVLPVLQQTGALALTSRSENSENPNTDTVRGAN